MPATIAPKLAAFASIALLCLFSSAQGGEFITIPWKGDYPHNNEKIWSKDYTLGWSANFMNGTPEEGGVVQKHGSLKAELFRPKGSGPFPFVILLHGCAGYEKVARTWAAEYAKALNNIGFGALALDSFSTRKVKESCGPSDGHWGRRRSEDAYSALDYLVEAGLADKNQVYLIGRSNGGLAVLMALEDIMAVHHPNKFAGGFSLVPACAGKKTAKFYAPLVAFVAGNDDANAPSHCIEMAQMRRTNSPPLSVTVYKTALHGYMDNLPSRTFHGWRMGYDPAAAADTKATVLESLRNRMTTIESGLFLK